MFLKMVSRLCLFVILNICLSICFADENYECMPHCLCFNEQLVCDNIEVPLDLKLLNSNITKVVISNAIIERDLFTSTSEVQHLTELSLVGCNVTNINSSAFSNMKSLTSLNIVESHISNFQSLNLRGTDLKNLNLTKCGLTFSNLPYLMVLMGQVPHLKKLVLDKNPIKNFSASIFMHLDYLENLHAQDCEIETIVAEESDFGSSLVEADFSNNRISRLPKFLFQSSKDSLTKLSLSGNMMSEIDLDFSDFKSLKSLKIDGMNLSCSCSWMAELSSQIIEPSDVKCHDSETDTLLILVDFMSRCGAQKINPEEESSKSLVIVIIILVVVAVFAAVGCLVHRILSNRRRRSQEKKTVRYSAVYRETVEPAVPTTKVTSA